MSSRDAEDQDLKVSPALTIPRAELEVRMSRAGGPGGQHVNTSSTRVSVVWNVKSSPTLSTEQRTALVSALGKKLSEEGSVRVVARDTRSQRQNWILAEERLAELIRKALVPRKPRKKTRPTRTAVEKRLDSKHKQSAKKGMRRSAASGED